MLGLENVIKGLRCCSMPSNDRDCDSCPVGFGEGCALKLKSAALALLEAQEPVEPKKVGSIGCWQWYCGTCGMAVEESDNYCHECGRKVKWDV